MIKEKDIVHENKNHWVLKKDNGLYEVYKKGVTHSTRCATIHCPGENEKALKLAIKECDKRALNNF